jgi:glycosyltransferase involved in cell wall biosynthesis
VRVLRLIARLNIGGPAIHAHLLTNGLDRRRFESFLVTGKISPQEGDMSYLFDDGDVLPISVPELQREISLCRDLRSFFQIFGIIRRIEPDIVHTHTAKAGTSARLAVMVYELFYGRGIFTVHTFHGHAFKGYFSRSKSTLFVWIERLLARITDVIIAISSSQKKELTEHYRIAPREKVKTVELGFDLDPFLSCSALKGTFRRQLGVADDIPLLGIIGRLVPIKNHRMFLDAARIFLDRHPQSKARFVIVGDGELKAELIAHGKRLGLTERLFFCGWIKQIPLVYADLDILSLTSLNEGTPVSIIEAMAASVPVVATNAGGVGDLLGRPTGAGDDGRYTICDRGIRCRVNDPGGLAGGWGHVLLAPGNAHNHVRSASARDFAVVRYSKERLLGDIEMLYGALMRRRQEAPSQPVAYLPAAEGRVI